MSEQNDLNFDNEPSLSNVINVDRVRRDWLRLSLGEQTRILKELEVPVKLPKLVGRTHPVMKSRYDQAFEFAAEHNILNLLDQAIQKQRVKRERTKPHLHQRRKFRGD